MKIPEDMLRSIMGGLGIANVNHGIDVNLKVWIENRTVQYEITETSLRSAASHPFPREWLEKKREPIKLNKENS